MAGMLGAIGSAAGSIGSAIGGAASSVGSAVGSAAGTVGSAVGGAANSIGSAFGGSGGGLSGMGSAITSGPAPLSGLSQASSMSGVGLGSLPTVPGGVNIGQTVGQMQAGPMGLGPAHTAQSGNTALSASKMPSMAGQAASQSSSQFWGDVKKELMSPENMLTMANRLGGGRVDNPPPQIGPMRFNNAPIQPGLNAGQMGLARLAASYGRR